MQQEQLLILGETNYRKRVRFGIKPADRQRPTLITGKTSMGKSTLLLNCIVQDIRFGNGVCIIDPHGDLVSSLLDYIPSHRINETIYFNPADTEYPIGFNVLHTPDPSQRHLVASGVLQVFKKVWGDMWGPRLEYVFRNALLALLEHPGTTLLGVPRLLTDDLYRLRITKNLRDPIVRHFWEVEYEAYPKVFRTETISPIQNKIGQFLSNPLTRNMLGQSRTRLHLRDIMDSGNILLVNLSKGKIGEDSASLLGALLVTHFSLAAVQRAHVPIHERRPFYWYIDEAQSVTTGDFPVLLAEARKYGLNIAGFAHQYLGQLPPQLTSALLGNIGTLIAFACGSEDAHILSREFAPTFTARDLQDLPQYTMYLKLSIDGKMSVPFSANTLPPLQPEPYSHREKIITQSRLRYAQPRRSVEEKMQQWLYM